MHPTITHGCDGGCIEMASRRRFKSGIYIEKLVSINQLLPDIARSSPPKHSAKL